jgi:RNA polymerase sigma factor (sigma-70 family)
MPSGQLNPVIRYLRRLSGSLLGETADEQLLQRFVTQKDETAFEALVRKYGPMVLGVCRRILNNPHDAEDAFQATFLVLVRKAASLSTPQLLANWLYGVAYRTALKARTAAAQRLFHEQQAMSIQAEPPANESSDELRAVIDDEVNRLPSKYRTPVILCYLTGKTNEEAARQLGCATGTIFSRLARARDMLRSRLARRGIMLSAAGLATVFGESAAAAVVPPSLAEATVKAALVLADGKAVAAGLISSSVLALTKGVQQAMFMNTLKVILAVGLAVAVVGGTGLAVIALAYDSSKQEKDKEKASAQPGKAPNTDKEKPALNFKSTTDSRSKLELSDNVKLNRLMKERVEAARGEVEARTKEFETGRGTLDFLMGASRRLLVAEWEMSDKKEDQLAALGAHLGRMLAVEKLNQDFFRRRIVQDVQQSKYYRLEAEIWLEKFKAGKFKLDLQSKP